MNKSTSQTDFIFQGTGGCLVCNRIRVLHNADGQPQIENACDSCRREILDWLEFNRRAVTDQAANIEAAANLLGSAKMPLICGLADQSLETQQAAVALARQCNAVIDWTADVSPFAIQSAIQETGIVSCTWQEIRDRSDLVVMWANQVERNHPEFLTRFVPKETTSVSVDWNPIHQQWALRLMRADRSGTAAHVDCPNEFRVEVNQLQEKLDQAKWPVIVIDDSLAPQIGEAGILSLFRLVRDQNDVNHCRLVCLTGQGNSAGIESTLTSLAGGPFGVTFRNGVPLFRGREFSVENLIRQHRVDAVLLVGSPDQLPDLPIASNVKRIHIADGNPAGFDGGIVLRSSRWGLGCDGTGLRNDGVPVLRTGQFECTLPTGSEICDQLIEKIQNA